MKTENNTKKQTNPVQFSTYSKTERTATQQCTATFCLVGTTFPTEHLFFCMCASGAAVACRPQIMVSRKKESDQSSPKTKWRWERESQVTCALEVVISNVNPQFSQFLLQLSVSSIRHCSAQQCLITVPFLKTIITALYLVTYSKLSPLLDMHLILYFFSKQL